MFSPRELDVIQLAGCSNRVAAVRLGMAYQTIKNHWSRIYEKLGICGAGEKSAKRIRAITTLARRGIIDLDRIGIDCSRCDGVGM